MGKVKDAIDSFVEISKSVSTALDTTGLKNPMLKWIQEDLLRDALGMNKKMIELTFVMNWLKTHSAVHFHVLQTRISLAQLGNAPDGITPREVELRLWELFPQKLTNPPGGVTRSSAQERAQFLAEELILAAGLTENEFWAMITRMRGSQAQRAETITNINQGIHALGVVLSEPNRRSNRFWA